MDLETNLIFGTGATEPLGPEPAHNPVTDLIYCHISATMLHGQILFDIFQEKWPISAPPDGFVLDLVNNGRPVSHTFDKPLEINIWKQTRVVIELDSDIDWHFWPGVAGMTVDAAKTAAYCGLNHIYVPDGAQPSQKQALNSGIIAPADPYRSKIIHFTALGYPVLNGQPDHFNLWIAFGQANNVKAVPVIVDPDVKDTGPPH